MLNTRIFDELDDRARVETVVRRALEGVLEVGGVPHHFLRHATDVHARAAHK